MAYVMITCNVCYDYVWRIVECVMITYDVCYDYVWSMLWLRVIWNASKYKVHKLHQRYILKP